VFDRLHALTAVTTVGSPLVGLGVAVSEGWTTATAMVLLIVAIVAVTGPVLGAATARMSGQREHLIEEEEPE
jgi:multicomponent Na+:H+ antiporter subunit G